MIAPLLAIGGALAILGGWQLLRRVGSGYRVGRLLAASQELTLQEVIALGRSGEQRYVRTHGRITSEEEFPDDQQRPLVYRRRRLQRAAGRAGWIDLDDERLGVPFAIEDRDATVAIDVDALGDGLVVVPRESTGTAGELPTELIAGPWALNPATPVRLRIEQVSAVEHATVAGVPGPGSGDAVMLSAGLGRPLILTTLEPAAAMRLLASGRRGGVMLAAGLLVAGPACLALAVGAYLLGL